MTRELLGIPDLVGHGPLLVVSRAHIETIAGSGAFLLATDGGLDGGGRRDGGDAQEPRLPTDAPTCLKKVLASGKYKRTRFRRNVEMGCENSLCALVLLLVLEHALRLLGS